MNVITSVSGGSCTAAYYGLFGERIFTEFETASLKRDVEGEPRKCDRVAQMIAQGAAVGATLPSSGRFGDSLKDRRSDNRLRPEPRSARASTSPNIISALMIRDLTSGRTRGRRFPSRRQNPRPGAGLIALLGAKDK
ncbi:MAG: hypothetical protein WCA44_08245 [Acidobacteriaceae bacterium]